MIVQLGFYVLSAIAFGMIVSLLTYADKKLVTRYLVSGSVWLIYVAVISATGILGDFSLPPRVPLFVVIPTVVASIVITGRPSFRSLLENAPLHLPVFMTSFRIVVELLIYGAYREGVFPQRVTFGGMNYDILVGVSACVVGVLVLKRRFSLNGLFVWNVVSLAILSVTVYAFASSYYSNDLMTLNDKLKFVRFPYLLVPAILLPVAIFLHVFSIRQVFIARQKRS